MQLKSIKFYFLLTVLLHGGHFLLVYFYSDQFFPRDVLLSQTVIFAFFLLSDLLIHWAGRLFSILTGQLFLVATTVKLVGLGFYFLVLVRWFEIHLTKVFILAFMFSYFLYLVSEVIFVIQKINREELDDKIEANVNESKITK